MKITVLSITPHEDMEMEAEVRFFDDSASPHCAAHVTVFVDNRDRPISEVRTDAIEKAKAFLLQAASSH